MFIHGEINEGQTEIAWNSSYAILIFLAVFIDVNCYIIYYPLQILIENTLVGIKK